ncbi:hypothetical protein AA0N74_07895 [Chromobacterium vaccinii]|uniref:hypothetical protein n=1 Tax=Chromobacterium vaccinii TaxID=1108595 RepID=UPI0031E3A774
MSYLYFVKHKKSVQIFANNTAEKEIAESNLKAIHNLDSHTDGCELLLTRYDDKGSQDYMYHVMALAIVNNKIWTIYNEKGESVGAHGPHGGQYAGWYVNHKLVDGVRLMKSVLFLLDRRQEDPTYGLE